MTRCSDSRGSAEEEVGLDGEGKRRRDGWRFDRSVVSGEDGGGDCESDAWLTWSERVRDGM